MSLTPKKKKKIAHSRMHRILILGRHMMCQVERLNKFTLMNKDGNCTPKSINPSKPARQNSLITDNFASCGRIWYYKLKPALGCG